MVVNISDSVRRYKKANAVTIYFLRFNLIAVFIFYLVQYTNSILNIFNYI